ncbi:MAG: hypothetical protein IT168_18085 [Bryobacterales bacterium]|nr:hypothetical protein [Bryobacterales bacterium]
MRAFAALLLLFLPAAAQPTMEALGQKWTVPIADDWKVESVDGIPTLQLLVPRPSTQPRRPTQYALAQTPDYQQLTLELEMKKEPAALRNRRTSLMIVYAWRDKDHFNYAHLSVDAARQQSVHNGIFHVYGGDRVRISSEEGPPTLTDESWHKVKLVYDGSKGRVDVYVNGESSPSMRAVDLSLGAGKFGIGSFFDLGSFRKLKVTGKTASGS